MAPTVYWYLHFSLNPSVMMEQYSCHQGSSSWVVAFFPNVCLFHLEIVLALTSFLSYFGQVQNSNAVLFSENGIVTAAFAYGSEIPVCHLDEDKTGKKEIQ